MGGADAGERVEEERVVFLGGETADVDDGGGLGGDAPRLAEGLVAEGGVEDGGIYAAGEQAHALETVGGELGVEFGGGREGDARAVVKVAEVGEGGTGEKGEAVVFGVAVEVGVETGGERESEFIGGGERGVAEGAFGGDVDEIGAGGAPGFEETAADGETAAQERVARNGEAGAEQLVVKAVGAREIGRVLTRTDDGDAVSAEGETLDEMGEGHGHAVDLGREGFGDEGDVHAKSVGNARDGGGEGKRRADGGYYTTVTWTVPEGLSREGREGREGMEGLMKGIIHVLTGPTAVGKTELALRWAEANGAEIVSCDALLFYRGMDIGTAKPTAAERARVPHHLIDLCDVDTGMDVTGYVERAQAVVADITGRGRAVLVAGGSGFYLKSFFAAVADGVEVPAELRAEIAGKLEGEGLAALVAELKALNGDGLGALDVENPRRVTRALERCRASGKTLAMLAEEFARMPGPFAGWEVKCTRLERERAELDARIARRVDAMIADGLVEEVERLRAAGLERNLSAARAIGYRETLAMLDGVLPRTELAAEIVKNTRALVKKQRTWFRTQLPEHRVIGADGASVTALFG